MQDNNREMHIIDAELFFVIDEKTNQIDLTDKGIEILSGDAADKTFLSCPILVPNWPKLKKKV